ncbi:MAG: tetratricopeptide repeat protein [Nitrospirae bacterium]|nr:tetratricopeptide repeat protein [Nitrospirota bacterium]
MTLDDTFLLGCVYIKEANYREALVCFRRLMAAYEEDKTAAVPADLLSYFGLALALGENRIQEAIAHCTRAIKKEFYHPGFYVNLARVYLKANRRSDAIKVLYKGLKIDSQDPVILSEIRKLGVRRKQIVGFLERGHPINKVIGVVTARLRAREKKPKKTVIRRGPIK